MNTSKPIDQTREDLSNIIDKISADSAVGIDAQYTHAIIIEYLKQLDQRLQNIEDKLNQS